jgi:hypothetical protein
LRAALELWASRSNGALLQQYPRNERVKNQKSHLVLTV